MNKNTLWTKINITTIYFLFSVLLSFGQEAKTLYETKHFAFKSVSVSYNYKTKDKKTVEGTKFSHYQVFSKDDAFPVNLDLSKNHFENVRKFDHINDCYQVLHDGKWGVLNLETGKIIIDVSHKEIESLDNQFFVAIDKKQQVYKLDGTKLIDFEFQNVRKVCDLIYDNGSKNLILFDLNGNKKGEFPATKIVSFFGNELILKQKEKFGILNREGKTVVPFEYDDAFFGDQYLSMGKMTAEGMKYKLFQGSNLNETIFEGEYDYIKDFSINKNDSTGNAYLILDKKTNTVQVLSEDKQEFMHFNHFKDGNKALEFATQFKKIDLFYDYVLVFDQEDLFEVFCLSGDKFSNEQFYAYSNLDNGFDGYVFFMKDHYEESFAVPQKIGNGKIYKFPFEIFSIEKLTDKAYMVSTDYGDNIFRPFATNNLVNPTNEELYLDYYLIENMQLALFAGFRGDYIGYDILKDSLFISNTKTSEEANQQLLNYVKWSIAPYLDSLKTKIDHPIKELIQVNLVEKGKNITEYTDENNIVLVDRVPLRFNFSKSTDGNGGTFFISKIEASEEPYYVLSTILDSKLNVIVPYTSGSVQDVRILKNDTIVLIQGEMDTFYIYSCHHKKMIYHTDLLKLAGGKNFYAKITSFGIMNEFGKKNGLMDYSGKILVPFQYEYYENEGFETNPSPVLDLINPKGIHCYYFVEKQTMIEGCKVYSDLSFLNEKYICLQTKPNQYQVYNRQNASLVFNETFTDIIYNSDNEQAIINNENIYGLFDFKNQVWLENLSLSEEEFFKIYDEKYLK